MTTLTVNNIFGIPAIEDLRVTSQQDADEVVAAVDSIEIPILADGLFFAVATLISRFVERVFGSADNYTNLEDIPDYYSPLVAVTRTRARRQPVSSR